MRILHVTDTHLGARGWAVDGAPPGWTRAADHADMLELALAPALREQVDVVVHSGDVFDRSEPPADAIARARSLLGQAARRVPVVVIAGNHDRRGVSASLGGIPGVQVCDLPTRVLVAGGLALGCVPYVGVPETWAAHAARAVGPGVDLLVAHQAFEGVRVPGFTFRLGAPSETLGAAHLPRGVRQVLCGHLHPRQVVDVGEARIVCPGSAERTAFSEADQTKGYAVWTAEARWTVALVDLPARPLMVASHPEDVRRVVPGAIVRVEGPFEADVRARGGWTVAPRAQLPLFSQPIGARAASRPAAAARTP